MTAAASKRPAHASFKRCTAKLTSEPFFRGHCAQSPTTVNAMSLAPKRRLGTTESAKAAHAEFVAVHGITPAQAVARWYKKAADALSEDESKKACRISNACQRVWCSGGGVTSGETEQPVAAPELCQPYACSTRRATSRTASAAMASLRARCWDSACPTCMARVPSLWSGSSGHASRANGSVS